MKERKLCPRNPKAGQPGQPARLKVLPELINCVDPVHNVFGLKMQGKKIRVVVSRELLRAKMLEYEEIGIDANLAKILNPVTRTSALNTMGKSINRRGGHVNVFRAISFGGMTAAGLFHPRIMCFKWEGLPAERVVHLNLGTMHFLLYRSAKHADYIPLLKTILYSFTIPFYRLRLAECKAAGMDVSAGIYHQSDGELPLVNAHLDPVVQVAFKSLNVAWLCPPGSTSEKTSSCDNSERHKEEHRICSTGCLDYLIPSVSGLVVARLEQQMQLQEKEINLKFPSVLKRRLIFAAEVAVPMFDSCEKMVTAVNGFHRACIYPADPERNLRTNCTYFSLNRGTEAELQNCLQAIKTLTDSDNTWNHRLTEADMKPFNLPSSTLDERFERQEVTGSANDVSRSRTICPYDSDYYRETIEREEAATFARAALKEQKRIEKVRIKADKAALAAYPGLVAEMKVLKEQQDLVILTHALQQVAATEKKQRVELIKSLQVPAAYNVWQPEANDAQCATCMSWYFQWQQHLLLTESHEKNVNVWHACDACEKWFCPDCAPDNTLSKLHEPICKVR
eukprot:gb/GEZN01002329.1/.p1 GENE.gb/GEZN01002329.1/~~gb/GEZN01002329.1/.p1  ORF type:complete len:566 (+),score=49.39 gb/GEZN01002329.1/:711-2408(+)